MNDALQWLQLLLVPGIGLLWRISTQLAAITAVQTEHARRIDTLERRHA